MRPRHLAQWAEGESLASSQVSKKEWVQRIDSPFVHPQTAKSPHSQNPRLLEALSSCRARIRSAKKQLSSERRRRMAQELEGFRRPLERLRQQSLTPQTTTLSERERHRSRRHDREARTRRHQLEGGIREDPC